MKTIQEENLIKCPLCQKNLTDVIDIEFCNENNICIQCDHNFDLKNEDVKVNNSDKTNEPDEDIWESEPANELHND